MAVFFNEFQPDLVAFNDIAGLGLYEVGHYRQHLAYATALAAKGIFVPQFNIMHLVGDNKAQLWDWLNVHENIHQQLRVYARVTGTDLTQLDPQDPSSWDNWQQYHRYEHYEFDNAFQTE